MSPRRLFMLGGVPDAEADDIRALLEEAEIDYYEVPASFLGVSPASLWLHDSAELEKAKALIDAYEVERALRARSEYDRLKKEGKHTTLLGACKAHPVRTIAYIAASAVILYLSLSPFLNFGK
jgi:hypothetical protein